MKPQYLGDTLAYVRETLWFEPPRGYACRRSISAYDKAGTVSRRVRRDEEASSLKGPRARDASRVNAPPARRESGALAPTMQHAWRRGQLGRRLISATILGRAASAMSSTSRSARERASDAPLPRDKMARRSRICRTWSAWAGAQGKRPTVLQRFPEVKGGAGEMNGPRDDPRVVEVGYRLEGESRFVGDVTWVPHGTGGRGGCELPHARGRAPPRLFPRAGKGSASSTARARTRWPPWR